MSKFLSILFLFSTISFSGLAEASINMDTYDFDAVESVYLLIYDQRTNRQNAAQSKFVMTVYVNGIQRENIVDTFRVSPGKLVDDPEPGKEPELTPEGIFHPQRLEKDWVSNQFGGKVLGIFETGKMPNSIFFHRGFAIHGSRSTVNGKPASKGCVRLRVGKSEMVFALVEAAIENTRRMTSITIDIRHTEEAYVRDFRIN
ncbi:MAG: L,D-transpeptidase [Bdellovibrionales bacterium]|nr:L,D-transpeptidase [Bdellovibrionales bacterium]